MTPPRGRIAVTLLMGAVLSGCGTAPSDRAAAGAGIGAAGGAIIGAAASLALLPAVAVGAAVGGISGLATDPEFLNLGEPHWLHHTQTTSRATASTAPSASHRRVLADAGSRGQIRAIQAKLGALGYRPGPADGVAGSRTRAAIRAYQQSHNLRVDGMPTPRLAHAIDAEIARLTSLTRADVQSAAVDER